MKRSLAIVATACAFVLALGLVACSGSSSGSAASSAAGASSGTSASAASSKASSAIPQKIDVPAEYLDIDGGITINALQGLTGPEVTALLKQQGYEWTTLGWKNATTENFVRVRSVDDKSVKEDGYASATGKGELAKGYVQILTHAHEIVTTDDLVTVRDAMAQGFTVEDSWLVGGGAFLYSVLSDAAGARYILVTIAESPNEARLEFSTDAYLTAKGDGGVDGIIKTWKS